MENLYKHLMTCLRKCLSEIGLKFLLVFFTFPNIFMKASNQEHNLLSDCAFGFRPFTYVCCKNCSMSCFSAFSFSTCFAQIIALKSQIIEQKLLVQFYVFVIDTQEITHWCKNIEFMQAVRDSIQNLHANIYVYRLIKQ